MSPAIPTKPYIILERAELSPKMASTKLNPKKPINPQLIAPMIVRIRAIL
jgi:hypothetical protein